MKVKLHRIVHYYLLIGVQAVSCTPFLCPFSHGIIHHKNKKMNKLKKIIVEIDGKETEYGSLSECAKALGVPPATIYGCASYGYRCKGYNVRYADGTRRIRKRKKATIKPKETSQIEENPQGEAKPQFAVKPQATAEDVNKLIARWYTTEWKEYVSSDALVSLVEYIKEHWN